MLKAKFVEVKKYIDKGNYHRARIILDTINHPMALKWLRQLDKLEMKKSRSKNGIFRGVLSILIIGVVGLYGLLQIPHTGLPANSLNAATATNTATLTWTPEYVTEAFKYGPTTIAVMTERSITLTATTIAATSTARYLRQYATTRTPRPTLTPITLAVPTLSYSAGGTRCKDGTYSSSTGKGTCSHHGGIAR